MGLLDNFCVRIYSIYSVGGQITGIRVKPWGIAWYSGLNTGSFIFIIIIIIIITTTTNKIICMNAQWL